MSNQYKFSIELKVFKIESSHLQAISAYQCKLKRHIIELVNEYMSKSKTTLLEMHQHNQNMVLLRCKNYCHFIIIGPIWLQF